MASLVQARSYELRNALGSDLIAGWDALRTDLIYFSSGSSVNMWRDIVSGLPLTQATSPAQPVWSATSLNALSGEKPGITFDGFDDNLSLTLSGGQFPNLATPCEMWLLCQMINDPSDMVERYIMSYGSGGADARSINRLSASTGNRFRSRVNGTGSALVTMIGSIPITTPAIARLKISGTEQFLTQNNETLSAAIVPATGTARIRLGARAVSTADNFCNVVISVALLTRPTLSDEKSADLFRYLNSRKD